MKKSTSLLKKYIFIILIAIVIIPVMFPLTSIIFTLSYTQLAISEPYYSTKEIEQIWNENSKLLNEENPEKIKEFFHSIHKAYPQASTFWVDNQGRAHFPVSKPSNIPSQWTVNYSIDFMKKSINGGFYTVVSYMGKEKKEAFMVIRLPKKYIEYPVSRMQKEYSTIFITVILLILIIFLIFSGLFFRDIRNRLIRLQKAMKLSKEESIPKTIELSKMDEIGLLEQNFNNMIQILEKSRLKEREEAEFRRDLIANLSHDLRTPLMVFRTQINLLEKEVTSIEGKEIIVLMDDKISYIAELIDNLLSYSLLTSKKYPFNPKDINITSLLRKIIASWYNSLEERGFYIDVKIPEKQIYWYIDQNWFQRIIDNVIQNVIRYASEGNYIGIYISTSDNQETISVIDHGPGFEHSNHSSKGTGIGLSIISLMSKEMDIDWAIDSTYGQTIISFKKK
ncbi:TPA: HAMP domain-containing histidine kinase [Bacillus cereus]|nr:HAMP domain-containing histidine kinase [Bacillus cereus]